MFKRLLVAIMIALPMSLFAQKFAVINTNALLESMPEIKTVNEKLEASSKKYEEEFAKLQEEFGKKFEEYQKLDQDPATPASIKERRTAEIQELDQKINQFRQTATQDLQRQQQELMAPVQESVMKAIQAVGAEGNYTFVFENVMPIYVGKDVTDITDTVKARLGVK